MALVNCPECGRKNVSDSAESCPDCGYGIKGYYDKIKEDELKKKQVMELQEKINESQQEYNKELEQRASDIEVPNVKPFMNVWLAGGIFFGFLTILMIVLEGWGLMLLEGFFAIILLWIGWDKLKISREIYDKHKDNVEQYKKEVIRAQDIEKAEVEMVNAYWKNNKNKGVSNLKCPVCGNTNVSKISTVNRATSVAMVGVASSKIGKQYECKNCKHKW